MKYAIPVRLERLVADMRVIPAPQAGHGGFAGEGLDLTP
jgi:hypothetical protein